MLTVSHKIKITVIAEDFPVEVDGGVAEHNSLLQCPSPKEWCSECAKAQDGTSDLFPLMHAWSYSVVAMYAWDSFAFARCDWSCAGNLEKKC